MKWTKDYFEILIWEIDIKKDLLSWCEKKFYKFGIIKNLKFYRFDIFRFNFFKEICKISFVSFFVRIYKEEPNLFKK